VCEGEGQKVGFSLHADDAVHMLGCKLEADIESNTVSIIVNIYGFGM